VPTGCVGAREQWHGANQPPRPLLDWRAIRALAAAGVEFGGHGVRHEDLTRLPREDRRREIDGSADALATALGMRPVAFAAPYGRVDAPTRADIRRTYAVAFGTRFARARQDAPQDDVPRVEMHYFRDASRWRAFLQGSMTYFTARRTMRGLRAAGRRLVGSAR
jgi:peptidoglycan/xylan/chitin deacetylase (PgdA/CDA1 family)